MRLGEVRLIFSDSSFIYHLLLGMVFQASLVQSSSYINPSVEPNQIMPKIDYGPFREDINELEKNENNISIFYHNFDPFQEPPNVEIDYILAELKELINKTKTVWFYIDEQDIVQQACQVIVLNIEKKIKEIEEIFTDPSFKAESNSLSMDIIEEYKKYLDLFNEFISKINSKKLYLF